MTQGGAENAPTTWSLMVPIDRLARRLLQQRLGTFSRGELVLKEAGQTIRMGEPADLQVSLQIHNPRFYRDVILGGSLSVAESYLRGDWDCDDLTGLFRIFVRNMDATTRLSSGLGRTLGVAHRLYHWWHSNSPEGSRKNIGAHYDLGNDFFQLWLDETMTYSSGIFSSAASSMADASLEKIDRLCRKLDLQPNDHLMEIGTGWGALAIHAARNYGCRVTTTTISQQQFRIARERIDQAGLSDRITLLSEDYRNLTGEFDKLVSVEMIEAVGHRYLDTFFRKCGSLLKPDGTMVLQGIVLPERGYQQYLQNVDFIQRYIFPGGCLPSLGSILESSARATNMRFVHAEDFAPHYAKTLRCWRTVFDKKQSEILQLGYSRQFMRMWTYYLCYCEAFFEERYGGVLQIQFDKPGCRRDPVHISEWASDNKSTVAPIDHRRSASNGRPQRVGS